MSQEEIDKIPYVKYRELGKFDLIDKIVALEAELEELRKPKQPPFTLNMANVDRLMVAAGWIPHHTTSYRRGVDAVTITYTNGIFRWAWKNSHRIEDFNSLLTVD